jgi:hypothetical protein
MHAQQIKLFSIAVHLATTKRLENKLTCVIEGERGFTWCDFEGGGEGGRRWQWKKKPKARKESETIN